MRVKSLSIAAIAATAILLLVSQGVVPTAQAAEGAVVSSSDCTQTQLPANDDGSTSSVDLPFSINFYGQTYDKLWVNNNGNVTFNGPLSAFTPFGLLATQTPIIAPFFADVDTRAVGSSPVSYGYGQTTFEGHAALCVDWLNVGYYSAHADKLDSFQLLLVSRPEAGPGAFDIVFNYGSIQWETGDASGGSGGLGGTAARAGFSAGTGITGTATELPGSGTPGAFLDSAGNGLANTDLGSTVSGRYVFPVRQGGAVADKYVALGDSYQSGEGAHSYFTGTDTSTNKCHRSQAAYPNLLVQDQAVRLTLNFRACSGAVIDDMSVANSTTGPPYDDGVAQLDALGPDTRLVTIGVVGNDLDFSGTVRACVNDNIGSYVPIYNWFTYSCSDNQGPAVDAALASLETGEVGSKLLALYRQVREKAPYARVVVVTYPEFFPAEGAGTLSCAWIARRSDQIWLNANIARADQDIREIATKAGFETVDMASAFDGHNLCTSDPAMHGVVDPLASESYHPNVLGHRIMADRIETTLGQAVEPSFVIHPQETVNQTIPVRGHAFTVNVAWPGSDVETELISPSGVEYTRANPNGAEHGVGPTYEYFEVSNPEQGDWTVRSYGSNVDPNGEAVTLTTLDEQTPNVPPTAVITTSGSGATYNFDAGGSADSDGSIVDYFWDFGDGTTGTGVQISHTFSVPGEHRVTLVTRDNVGGQGFGDAAQVIDIPANSYSLSSGSSLTLTDQFASSGAPSDVRVSGDFDCDVTAHIHGNVIATGNAHITSGCVIDGDIQIGGDALVDGSPSVLGSLQVGGNLSYQSTAHISGDLDVGGTLTVLDGKTTAQLIGLGSVGGGIQTGIALVPPVVAPIPGFDANNTALWAGYSAVGWRQLMNATAIANNAPTWSTGRTANPGCTMSAVGDSVGGPNVNITTNSVIDARATLSGCSSITIQGMSLALSADVSIVADNLQLLNGLTVTSADGKSHELRLIVAGTQPACTSGRDLYVSSGMSIDPLIGTELYSAGKTTLTGPTSFAGKATAACIEENGLVNIQYRQVTTSGID